MEEINLTQAEIYRSAEQYACKLRKICAESRGIVK